MPGKKRSVNGQVKPAPPAADIAMPDATPPCAQPPPPSSKTASTPSTTTTTSQVPQKIAKPLQKAQAPSKPISNAAASTTHRKNRQKLAKLPSNTSITKRPLVHPALPTPFASAAHAKTLYVTARTPYIPAVKRVRKLLGQISAREKQGLAARDKGVGRNNNNNSSGGGGVQANGRLQARDVEREIVGEAARKAGRGRGSAKGGAGGERVYIKATGRAIPRALEIALCFQADDECSVTVDMGNVTAIDDIEVRLDDGAAEEEENGNENEIPETRVRMLSCVTVSIGFAMR